MHKRTNFLESGQKGAAHLGLSMVEMEEVEKDGREEREKKQNAKFTFKAKYKMLIVKIGRAHQVQQVCHVLPSQHSKEGTWLWISLAT